MSDVLKPPSALDSEAAILASVIGNQDALDDVSETLRPEDFFDPKHRAAFEACLAVAEAGESYDYVAIAQRVRLAGKVSGSAPVLIAELSEAPAVANLGHHAKIVRDKARQRNLIARLQHLVAEGYGASDVDAWVERVETEVHEAIAERDDGGRIPALKDALAEVVENIEARCKPNGNQEYIPTSIPDLNRAIGGWDIGSYTAVAARPGVGKTSLVIQESFHAAGRIHNGHVVASAVFSIEMKRGRLLERALSQASLVESNHIRHGKLDAGEWSRIVRTVDEMSRLPVYIDDSSRLTVAALRSRLRRLNTRVKRDFGEKAKVKFVVLDYLQLMVGDNPDRYRNDESEVNAISQGLRRVAKDFDVALVVVCSMNRDQSKSKTTGQSRPQMSDLRGSGQIEFDAGTIMFLYNETSHLPPSQRSPDTTAIFAKTRFAGPTDVPVHFDGRVQRYQDATSAMTDSIEDDFGPVDYDELRRPSNNDEQDGFGDARYP